MTNPFNKRSNLRYSWYETSNQYFSDANGLSDFFGFCFGADLHMTSVAYVPRVWSNFILTCHIKYQAWLTASSKLMACLVLILRLHEYNCMSWSFFKEINKAIYVDIGKFSDGCWVKYYLSRTCSQSSADPGGVLWWLQHPGVWIGKERESEREREKERERERERKKKRKKKERKKERFIAIM